MMYDLLWGAVVLVLHCRSVHAAVDDWHFEWPTVTSQCQSITVSITGGVPPWSLQIVPIGQQPLYWDFTAPDVPFNASYPATATIPLQLQAGTAYVALMSDSEGYNEAPNNPTVIQVVQPSSDSSCFAAASPAKKDFDFQVYGSVTQCERSFGVTWTTTVGTAPYGCTIVPLDTSYNPWDVLLTEAGSLDDSAIWRVNMTSGTRFTVIMHDGYGTGRGGVGQIYEVASSNNISCITQQYSGRADWPAGLQVSSVPSSTTAWGPGPTNTSTNTATDVQTASTSPSASSVPAVTGGSTKSLGTGAIAGIAAGGVLALLVLAATVFLCLRRRRRRGRTAPRGDVDLIGGGTGGGVGHVEPKIEPFRSTSPGAPLPTMVYAQSRTQSGYDPRQLVHTDSGLGVHGVDTPGSVPFPTPGQGFFSHEGPPGSNTSDQTESADRRPTSPYATPLSDKVSLLRGLNAAPAQESPLSSPGVTSAQHGYYAPPPSSSGVSSSETKVGHSSGFGSTGVSPTSPHRLPPIPLGSIAPTEFRRHTDAGEMPDQGTQQSGVVDLPPLYTDVPARRAGASQQQQ